MATALDEALKEGETESRKVLITGVSKGLGRALALELGSRGHIIIGCSRDQTKLDSLSEELSSLSTHQHLLLNTDVRFDCSVEDLARAVVENKLVPDIIVNNAGLAIRGGAIWEVGVQNFDNVIDTNVKGIANVLRHFIPLMISNKQGIIVNISSDAGRNVYPNYTAYCASKWAVEGLSKSVTKEVPEEIAIVTLDPGLVNTDMLVLYFGDEDLASEYQSPKQWARRAASMILDLTKTDNGGSLIVKDPNELSIP